MRKRNKGEYGYVHWKKTMQLLYTIITVVVGITIFAVGYWIHDRTTANLFTVVAMLSVLPGAKYLTGFIVLFPYRTISASRYEKIQRYGRDGNVLLYDLVITSSQKVMNLDALILTNEKAFGLIGKKGQDVEYIAKYLSGHMNRYVEGYSVQVLKEEAEYLKVLEQEDGKPFMQTKEREEMVRDVMTLIV